MPGGVLIGTGGGARVSAGGGVKATNASGACPDCSCGGDPGGWPTSGWIVGTPCKEDVSPNRPIVLAVSAIRAYLLATYGSENPANVPCVVATAATNVGAVCARFGPGMPVVTSTANTYIANGIVPNCCTCGDCYNNVGFNVSQTQPGSVSVTLPSALCCLPRATTGDIVRNVGSLTYSSFISGVFDGTSYELTKTASVNWDHAITTGAGQIVVSWIEKWVGNYIDPFGSPYTVLTDVPRTLTLQVTPATFINGWYITSDPSANFVLNFATLEQTIRPYIRTAVSNQGTTADSGSVTVACDRIGFSITRTLFDGSETWSGQERWIHEDTKGCGPRCGAGDAAAVSLSSLAELFA